MKTLCFDASNTNTRVSDLHLLSTSGINKRNIKSGSGAAEASGAASGAEGEAAAEATSLPPPFPRADVVPRSLYVAALCVLLFLLIPIIFVGIVFSPESAFPTNGTAVRAVDWAIRVNAQTVPAFVIWLCACYNLGMQPSHLWDVEGTEKRLAEQRRAEAM